MESRSDVTNTLDPLNVSNETTSSDLFNNNNNNQTTIMANSLVNSNPAIDDSLAIAYQDHFDLWPQVDLLFKYLTRFDLKLTRNLKLESLNDQLIKGSGAEDLRVTVRCRYIGLPLDTSVKHTPKSHHFSKGKENPVLDHLDSAQEDREKNKEKHDNDWENKQEIPSEKSELEAKDEDLGSTLHHSDVETRGSDQLFSPCDSVYVNIKDSSHPYLYLFLIPPSCLSDYRQTIKPKLKEFIANRMKNKLNEEFLIVAFMNKGCSTTGVDVTKEGSNKKKGKLGLGKLTSGKEGEDKKVIEKVRSRLFKQKLRSRLVVVAMDPIDITDSENNVPKDTELSITSAIRESGIDKMMRTLLNLSVNKRYLYILINVNKMFLPFLNARNNKNNLQSGVGSNDGGVEISGESNKRVASAANAGVAGSISALTVGSYLVFVEALENLCNLFYKLQLTLKSVFLYEFLLYNECFTRLLSLFKAAAVDEGFYSSYNVLNSYSSEYYSILRVDEMSSCGPSAAAVGPSESAKYCYVRYRLYILSKQLLMLNTINTSSGDSLGMERLSVGTGVTDVASRATTSTIEGVASVSNSGVVGATVNGFPENLLFFTVLLIYNFINDVYFQVIGCRAIPSVPTTNMFCTENGDNVIREVTGVGVKSSTLTVRRIKWLLLITVELVRHLEHKLNSELAEDAGNDYNYLGEVVRGKKNRFRFLKSIFKTSGLSSSSKGSDSSKATASNTQAGSTCGDAASNSISQLVSSYYGIKYTENLYKYVSFIYLILYKLVLQLASVCSGGTTTVTASTVEGAKYDDDGLDAYIDAVYNSCLRLHYSKITTESRSEVGESVAVYTGLSGIGGSENMMSTIDQLLERIVDYKVAIIERCSRYFILSNLQSYSNVLRSYYLRPNSALQSSSSSGSAAEEGDATRGYGGTWLDRDEFRLPLDSDNLLGSDTTNTETTRTMTTDRSTPGTAAGNQAVYSKPGAGASKVSGSSGKTDPGNTGRTPTKATKLVSTICSAKHLEDEEEDDFGQDQQGDQKIHCSLTICNEYDHLYNKNFKRSALKTLNVYPSCYNYVHLHLKNRDSEKLEGEVYLQLSTIRSDCVAAINRIEGASKFTGATGTSMLEVDVNGLTVINVDNKVVNIAVGVGQGAAGSSANGGSNAGGGNGTNMGAIKLPGFTSKMIVCVPLKLCDPTSAKNEGGKPASYCGIANSTCTGITNSGVVKGGLKFNISLTNTSTTVCSTVGNSSSANCTASSLMGSISTSSTNVVGGRSYSVKVREIFDLTMSESKGVKNIHVRVLYRDLVKIHQIYLNNNIIAGTTLLDYDSIYRIVYQPGQSTTSTTPTNRTISAGNGNADAGQSGSKAVESVDMIKIYYSLYRKYRSSLQQLTHNQLYVIDPASLPNVDSETGLVADERDDEDQGEEVQVGTKETDKESNRRPGGEEPASGKHEVAADLTLKVPGYAFVSRPINMSLQLLSKASTKFSYSIESNESWFIEGLVVNNNVHLTEGKKHNLQFRLIPLKEGRLEVPVVKFRGLKVEVPRREVTVFPANYLLL